MLFGYNTNIPYKGKMYHVQTEDTGEDRHTLITLLYYEGAILRSKKASYADLIRLPDFESRVRQMMKEQHKEMLKSLIAGKFDEIVLGTADKPHSEEADTGSAVMIPPDKPEKTAEKPEKKEHSKRSSRSLDDILLEHISRKVKDR
jgi:hypothetical protein